jgi:SAM-dependent methyltransferase
MKRIIEPELMLDDEKCKDYDLTSYRQYKNKEYLQSYKKYCGLTKGSLIDLGSGPGFHLAFMQQEYPELSIVGYENSEAMLKLSMNNTTVDIIHKDFYDITDTSDVVLCMYTLHHQHDPIKFWKKVSEISKGYVYIEDLERPEDESMFDLFDAIDDFKHSLRAAFTLDEIQEQLSSLNLPYNVIREEIDKSKNLYKIIIYQKM